MHRITVSLFVGLLLAGCAGTRLSEPPITVEGTVTSRGSEPLTTLVLTTDQQSSYVLCLGTDCSGSLGRATPVRIRATGQVYRDQWNGRPYAHLQVAEVEVIER